MSAPKRRKATAEEEHRIKIVLFFLVNHLGHIHTDLRKTFEAVCRAERDAPKLAS